MGFVAFFGGSPKNGCTILYSSLIFYIGYDNTRCVGRVVFAKNGFEILWKSSTMFPFHCLVCLRLLPDIAEGVSAKPSESTAHRLGLWLS